MSLGQGALSTVSVKVVAVSVLLVCLVVSSTKAAPVETARWLQPCSGSLPARRGSATFPPFTTAASSPARNFHNIAQTAKEVRTIVKSFRNKFASERIQNPDHVEALKQFSISAMPFVPKDDAGYLEKLQGAANVQKTYESLAKVVVILQFIRRGEDTHEEGRYTRTLKTIEEKMFLLLCKLHKTMKDMGLEVSRVSITNIKDTKLEDTGVSAYRYDRDYIIIRDLEKLLSSITEEFEYLKDKNSR